MLEFKLGCYNAPPRLPPLAVASPAQARPSPALASSGLRMSRRCLPTQLRLESAPGTPDSLTPATPPPREPRRRRVRRRPRTQFPLAVRSVADGPD